MLAEVKNQHSTSLIKKEKEALKLIKNILPKFNKPVIACSWGKDSLVTLHLVKRVANKLNIDFDVLWNNTRIHYPSVYKIKKRLEQEWNLNIVETKAIKTFWQIVEEYGWPGVNSSDRSDKANYNCCYWLKKKPTKNAIKKNNWDLYFDGLTAYESDRRYLNLKEYGLVHFHKTFKLTKVHPVGWWGVNDIWDYIEKYNIPYPDLYDKEVEGWTKRGYTEQVHGHRVDRAIRSGCWTCTLVLGIGDFKMKQLRTYYPKLWEALMKKGLAKEIAKHKLGGQGSLFEGYFNEDNIDFWLKKRPCFFDTINGT